MDKSIRIVPTKPPLSSFSCHACNSLNRACCVEWAFLNPHNIILRGRVELFAGMWVSCCLLPKRDDAGWSENCMPRCNALKTSHLPERKVWSAIFLFIGGRVSCCWVPEMNDADKVKLICRRATPWKTSIFLRGRVELFTVDEWAAAES